MIHARINGRWTHIYFSVTSISIEMPVLVWINALTMAVCVLEILLYLSLPYVDLEMRKWIVLNRNQGYSHFRHVFNVHYQQKIKFRNWKYTVFSQCCSRLGSEASRSCILTFITRAMSTWSNSLSLHNSLINKQKQSQWRLVNINQYPLTFCLQAQVCYQPNVCCRNPPPPPPPTPFVPQESHDEFATRPPPPRPTPGPGLTSEGYFIQTPAATTARPVYTTPTPYVPPRNTPPPYKGDEYIPPKDNHIGEPSNTPNSYLPPNRGEQDKSEPIPRPSNDELSVIRPGGPTAPPPLPPIQCPAATNCTEVQFCTSDGVISKTPVILTRDQETYRVPLSDCRDLSRGITGKCCRDPDYVDPWPTSILGQYNATILGFDDGSYKPNPNELGAPARLTQPSQRGQGQLSLPIQGAQATQQTYTRTPFLQGVNSQNYKSTNTPEPNSISPREKPATNKYQQPQSHNPPKQQYQPQQHFLSQPQQHQSTGYTNAHPLIRHEVSEQQQQRQPQQPIVHRHVQRQSEPIQPNYEPFPTQPAFFQPIVAQEPQQFLQTIQPRQPLQPQQPVSQQQFPFDTQSFTKNPANGVCAIRDTVSVH